MKRRHYIFTRKKNSERGIMSAILGVISIASLGIVVYLSYRKGGNVPVSYGLTGFLAAVFSVVGLVLGTLTLQEKEIFKLFPVLGLILNFLALGALMFLVQLGF